MNCCLAFIWNVKCNASILGEIYLPLLIKIFFKKLKLESSLVNAFTFLEYFKGHSTENTNCIKALDVDVFLNLNFLCSSSLLDLAAVIMQLAAA